MRYLKMVTLCLALLAAKYGFAQQREFYEKAAKAYREAAAKTKCPETRGKVLLEYANWNDRMAKSLGGGPPAGAQPTKPVPPCDGDMIGGGGGSGAGSTGSGTTVGAPSSFGSGADQSAATAALSDAYQNALNSGKKESGAVLDGFLAAAQTTSDAKLGTAYVGTGLVIGGLMSLAEKKAEREARQAEEERQAELARQQEAARQKFITDKWDFVGSFEKKFFKPAFSTGVRKAILIVYPQQITDGIQEMYLSSFIPVSAYSDGSFPLKENVLKSLLPSLPATIRNNASLVVKLAYPVQEPDNFSQLLSQIGSACEALNFAPKMIAATYRNEATPSVTSPSATADFWGNPVKKGTPEKKDTVTRKSNDFWNN